MIDRFLSPRDALERLRVHHAAGGAPSSDDLAALVAEFVGLKRLLGHSYRSEARRVAEFLRFQQARGVLRASQLSREAVLAYAETGHGVHPTTWRNHVCALSVFLDHLGARGLISENPAALLRRPRRAAYRPYLFSPDELRAIFLRLPALHPPARTRALVYAILYAGALRVSEALRLRWADFDGEAGTLRIEKTKFGKDRLVPLHPRAVAAILAHGARQAADVPREAPLFVNAAGRAFERDRFIEIFRRDLVRLGLDRPRRDVAGVRYGRPKLHSFRHTFAVNRLLQWYRAGADVSAKLPLLSTFLGHGAVEHTQVYLTITGLLLREAHGRFAWRCEKELPLEP